MSSPQLRPVPHHPSWPALPGDRSGLVDVWPCEEFSNALLVSSRLSSTCNGALCPGLWAWSSAFSSINSSSRRLNPLAAYPATLGTWALASSSQWFWFSSPDRLWEMLLPLQLPWELFLWSPDSIWFVSLQGTVQRGKGKWAMTMYNLC